MRLHWIKLYEQDGDGLQEVFVEREQGMIKRGTKLVLCSCGWVPLSDWTNFCKQGYHEFANRARVDETPEEVQERVQKLSETQV